MDREREEVIRELVCRHGQFRAEAYVFLLEALDYTIQRRGKSRKHVSGAELLEGFRDYAVQQFGFLARAVLEEWGLRTTDDVGEVVFHLIDEEFLQKTADDRKEDFHALFDFDEAFADGFRTVLAKLAL